MNRIITRTVLAGSGAILSLIGGALLLTPKAFLEASNVLIDSDPSLISELSASSGMLLISGAFMILGAARLRFANMALSVGAVVYGSYGLSRLISMGMHGFPTDSLIAAMVVELAVSAMLVAIRLSSPIEKRWTRSDDLPKELII